MYSNAVSLDLRTSHDLAFLWCPRWKRTMLDAVPNDVESGRVRQQVLGFVFQTPAWSSEFDLGRLVRRRGNRTDNAVKVIPFAPLDRSDRGRDSKTQGSRARIHYLDILRSGQAELI
jgi:hypothetical protein